MSTARGAYSRPKKLKPYGQTKQRRVTTSNTLDRLEKKHMKLFKRKKPTFNKYKKKLHSILVQI